MKTQELGEFYKKFLRKLGLNPKEYRYVRKDYDSLTFLETDTGRLMVVRR